MSSPSQISSANEKDFQAEKAQEKGNTQQPNVDVNLANKAQSSASQQMGSDTAEDIASLQDERLNPGANTHGTGGTGAPLGRPSKGVEDEQNHRDNGVYAGTERTPKRD